MQRASSPSLLGCAGFLVAAMLLAAGKAPAAPGGGKPPPDLALVLRDATGFVAVRVAEVAGALERLGKDDPTLGKMLKHLDGKGLAPAGIERVIAIFQRDPAFVVTFAKPFDREKLRGNLVPAAKERKAGGRTYLADADNSTALFVVNDRSIVFGPPAALGDLFGRLANGKDSPALDAALDAASGKHFLVAGLNPEKVGKDVTPAMKPFLPLLGARGTVAIDLGDRAWACTVRLPYDSEADAGAGEKAAREGLDALRAQLPQMRASMSKGPEGSPQKAEIENVLRLFREVEAGLKEAKVTRAGKVVEGSMRVPSENPARSGGLMLQSLSTAFILFRPSPPPPRPTVPRPEKSDRR